MVSLFIHFLITFSSANSWAFVRSNTKICCVLNQLCNKALNATIGEERRFVQFSVCPDFRMVENLIPKHCMKDMSSCPHFGYGETYIQISDPLT